ncbi:MAG: hypothetical protein GWP91_18760, partial [Rhodobacterales bacterium]|nr:hypothetical protein [Rhodobacterales bacterium]
MKVRVRIAAESITAVLFGLSFACIAVAGTPPEPMYEAVLHVNPATARQLSLTLGFTLDHGTSDGQSRILAPESALNRLAAAGVSVSVEGLHGSQTIAPPPEDGYRMP